MRRKGYFNVRNQSDEDAAQSREAVGAVADTKVTTKSVAHEILPQATLPLIVVKRAMKFGSCPVTVLRFVTH